MILDKQEFFEMAKLVYRAYPALNENLNFTQAFSMIDRLEKNIFVIKEKNEIIAIALYFLVDDMTIERIKMFVYDIRKPEGINELFNHHGGHLHIVGLVSLEKNANIKKWIKEICEKFKPKTISWFNRTFTDFIMKEVI